MLNSSVIRTFIYSFILFIGHHTLYAQSKYSIISQGGNKYIVDGETRHFYQMQDVFLADISYLEPYKKARRSLKGADLFGFTTIGLISTGALAILLDNNNDRFCDLICLTTGDVYGIFAIGLIAPITGTTAIILKIVGDNRKSDLINHYNHSINELGQVIKQPRLNFTGAHSGAGLGIMLQF